MLDIVLTAELKEEGVVRELTRTIQDLRKEKGFTIQDKIILKIDADSKAQELIMKNKNSIFSTTLLKDLKFENLEGEIMTIGEFALKMSIDK